MAYVGYDAYKPFILYLNGEHIHLTKEAESFLSGILDGTPKTDYEIHTLICDTLQLPRFTAALDWTPYAIRQSLLEIFFGESKLKTLGGHYYCAHCHGGLDIKPTSNICPRCKQGKLNNVPTKKQPYPMI